MDCDTAGMRVVALARNRRARHLHLAARRRERRYTERDRHRKNDTCRLRYAIRRETGCQAGTACRCTTVGKQRVADETTLDPRIRRTRRMLREAVLDLAAEHDFAEITVRDITARADVNRATFYLHYRNKEDLVAQALEALFAEFTAEDRAFVAAHPTLAAATVPPGIVAQFRHVGERAELFRRLLGGTGSSAFAARLRAYHERQFLRVWRDMGLA